MDHRKNIGFGSRFGILALSTFAIFTFGAKEALAGPVEAGDGAVADAQIVQRALTFNRDEVEASDAVRGRLVSLEAWRLAQSMRVDYFVLGREFESLAATAIGANGGDISSTQVAGADLSKLSGRELDKAYVDREILSHEVMLAVLDVQLVPNARSAEVRRQLTDLRSEVAVHLKDARGVQRVAEEQELISEQRALISREIYNDTP